MLVYNKHLLFNMHGMNMKVIPSLVYSYMFHQNSTTSQNSVEYNILYNTNTYYITMISVAELKNVRSCKMLLKFYAWTIVVGFALVYKHLVLFLIHYGSHPISIPNLLLKVIKYI